MPTVTRVITVEKDKDKVGTDAASDGEWKEKCLALEDEAWLQGNPYLAELHGL